MKALNLKVKQKGKFKVATDCKLHLPVAENVITRKFQRRPQSGVEHRYRLSVDIDGLDIPDCDDRHALLSCCELDDGTADE